MKSTSLLPVLGSLLCILAEPTLATSADRSLLEGQLANVPTEVVALANRALECRHWSMVEISDGAIDAMVERTLDSLRCDSLDADGVALRRKFAQSPPALRALDSARELFP